jgi:hypothetical protein
MALNKKYYEFLESFEQVIVKAKSFTLNVKNTVLDLSGLKKKKSRKSLKKKKKSK